MSTMDAVTNGWLNSTKYTSINIGSDITAIVVGGSHTGKYYTSSTNWRIYQSEGATLTIIASEGKTIVSVKITYAIDKNSVLTSNNENVASGTVVNVNANSITFGVGNTGTATNGQVRITSIEVVYE